MHSTCINSATSLWCKGSLSISFNDCTHFLDDRFDGNPLSLSHPSSCCCCANSIYRVRINPSLLYGLRQSTLIQWLSFRRLVLNGRNQCYSRLSASDLDRYCYYEKFYSFKDRSVNGKKGRWGSGRYACRGSDERSKTHLLSNVDDDVELMLSLLTEEVGGECFGVRERKGRSSRRVQLEKRRNSDGPCCKSEKKNVGSGGLEGASKCDYEYVTFQSREEDKQQKEDKREIEGIKISKHENRRGRKEGSSRSSYYSFSSASESESDKEVEVKHDGYVKESLSEYKRDRKGNEDIRYDGEVKEKVERRQDYFMEHGVFLKKENAAKGLYEESNSVDCDWRNKSEKKLSVVAIEETESREGYADRHEKSTLAVNIHEGTRRQHNQKVDRITGQSESGTKYKQFLERPEIHSSVVNTTSSSQKRYRDTEKNLSSLVSSAEETTGKRSETTGGITRQDEIRRNSQQIAKLSEIQEIDIRGTSSSLPETRMKNWEDSSTEVLGLVHDTEEKHQKTGQLVRQTGSRVKSQQFTGISDTHDINTESTPLSLEKSDIRMKKQEENLETSYSEVKVIDAERVPLKRTNIKERYSSSLVNSVDVTRQSRNLTAKGVLQIESRKDARRPTKASSFHVGMPKEASSSYKSLKLNPESNMQQVGAIDGDNSSGPIVTAPSSELVVRGPLRVEPTNEFSSENLRTCTSEVNVQTQEGSLAPGSEFYDRDRRGNSCAKPLDFISNEDALGSADRLQKSSMHFVGEFVEQARHEVSTSVVQKEKKTLETKLVHRDVQHKQKSPGQEGSGNSHPKDHDSRRSSRGSGPNEPSDEMWHVTDPSKQDPSEIDAPEITTTFGSGVVKRTGRSLWNIIGDIVRLRWFSSRSETHISKSGGSSSPNQSNSSEAWFSGHEPYDNNGENVSMAEKQQPAGIRSRSQREVSSQISSMEKIEHAGVESPWLSNTSSGSAPKNISSFTVEETYARQFECTSSGTVTVESSFPLPAIRMRRSLAVKDVSEAGQTDASGSGIKIESEQPVSVHLTEAKDGELKRRKLQRSDHVLNDRFDEWEEVHTLETEQRKIDETFMGEALLEARKAADMWEVPVGAVLVQHGKIIARGYNLVEDLRDSTAHAEMICIREASNILRTWRLSETTLYVTLEPCPMCAGAILQARIDTVVWGAPNKLLGADGSWIRLFPNEAGGNGLELTDKPAAPVHPFHPNIAIRRGVLSSECADVMQQFFQLRRKKKENKTEQPPTPPSCLPISSHHPSKFFTRMHHAFHIMFCL